MRVRDGVDKKGNVKYKMVEPKKLSEKQKKFLKKGKKRLKFKISMPKELPEKEAELYANIAVRYASHIDEGKSDQDTINKINRFLNKNPRIKKKYKNGILIRILFA